MNNSSVISIIEIDYLRLITNEKRGSLKTDSIFLIGVHVEIETSTYLFCFFLFAKIVFG